MAEIFISYSRDDAERCDAVYRLLKGADYSVAIDRIIETGALYRERIAREIDAATIVIVLWSASAIKKAFVLDEVDRAKRQGKILLPLILDDTQDGEVLGYGQLQSLRCEWSGDRLTRDCGERLLSDVARQLRSDGPIGAAVLESAVNQLRAELERHLGNEYKIEERLGTGRMTVVFSAEQPSIGRRVALKVAPLAGILLLPGFYAEFRGALEAAKVLSHPNILALHDFRLLATIACTVVDYVDGESLARHIARASEPLAFWLVKEVACKIAEALAYAHSHGAVHCRLCPNNVMIELEHGRVLVADFGMPNVGSGPDATAAKALFLDARYMSPEHCIGEQASPKSDQYALGAIVYEMLTGRPPFIGKTAFTIMRQQCEASVRSITELRPDCPPEVESSVLKMLSKSPDERYFATAEMLSALRSWPLPECPHDQPLSGAEPRTTCAALASFDRCLGADNLLLLHFYERLCKDPELAGYFKQTNMDRLIEMLRKGIRHLLEYGMGDEDARRELERVAANHRHLALDADLLRRFTDTLVAVVLEYDRDAADPEERERLRREWHETIEPGLAPFLRAAAGA